MECFSELCHNFLRRDDVLRVFNCNRNGIQLNPAMIMKRMPNEGVLGDGHRGRAVTDRCMLGWLLGLVLFLCAVPAKGQPPSFASILAGMQKRLATTTDYRCRFETQSSNGDQSRDVVLAYYYRRPAKIRMEVLEGAYSGSLLIYNREIDPQKVRVLAGNPLVAFLQRMLYGEFFAVDHEWVVDLRGNGIHESDWAHFITEHEKYLHMGTSIFLGEEILNGRKSFRYRLISKFPEKTMSIKEEEVWVDAATYFPMKYFQYDSAGLLLRRAVTTELRFNSGLSERLFLEFDPDIH
jgi:outer membrane lipoprotein-sorting protein